MKVSTKTIKLSDLVGNNGQLKGLPKNPRIIKDNRFKALKQSIKDSPEFLKLRELLVYPFEDKFIVIAGNQRLAACKDLKIKEVPCKVLPIETPIEKLKEYTIKDNVSFGEMDWEVIKDEWANDDLGAWGEEVPEWGKASQKSTSSVKQVKSNMTKSIKIDFDSQDYDEVMSTIKSLRSEGINVGTEIKKALVKLSKSL